MVRPIQPLGTYGVITVRRTKSGYVASARFRELTGAYRRVSASAPTATTAENELKAKIAAGLPSTAEGDLNGQTKLTVVADVWLDEIEQRQEQAPQTIEVYRDIVRRIILPAVGELRLNELTVGILDRFLKAEAARGNSRGRAARVVLAQIIDLAVRHDALPRNPVRSTAPLRRSRSEIRSLTLDELTEIRRIVRSHRTDPGVPGPPPDGQLAQLFELMLGTSARIGEALAVRRCDVDLDAEQPLVTITGTIVYVRGQGFLRQPHPKHSKYWRTVTVPSFTADALRDRLAATGEMRPGADDLPHQGRRAPESRQCAAPVALDPRRERGPVARGHGPRNGRASHASKDRCHHARRGGRHGPGRRTPWSLVDCCDPRALRPAEEAGRPEDGGDSRIAATAGA